MNYKLLLIAYFDPNGLLTIREALKYFSVYSRHDVTICNLYPSIYKKKNVDFRDYDGVIFHNTVAYSPETLHIIEQTLNFNLTNYDGLKILFKQDEHVKSHVTARMVGEKGFDLVFTCVSVSEQEKVYPKHLIGRARLVQHYTGYLSEPVIQYCVKQDYSRNIDIGYRGSIQPLQCGVLGFEKWHIGEAVKLSLQNKPYHLDISSRWEDRIAGLDWLNFLLTSKVTLGVESGSNLFDFDGKIAERCRRFEQKNKKLKANPEFFYRSAHTEFLSKFEGNVHYAQVSPRHFEAAMTSTLQVLYEGEYSGIFRPYEHYVPLKRDLSNLEEIEEYILNPKMRSGITDRAFEEIVLNEHYNIKTFICRFDQEIDDVKKSAKTRAASEKLPKSNVILLTSSSLKADDNAQVLEERLKRHFHVVSIGAVSKRTKDKYIAISNDARQFCVNTHAVDLHFDQIRLEAFREDYFVLEALLAAYVKNTYQGTFNASFHSRDVFERHRANCMHYLKLNAAYQYAIEALIAHNGSIPSALVCYDLPTLLPAVILAEKCTIPVIYTACKNVSREGRPLTPWEVDFWKNYEAKLMPHVQLVDKQFTDSEDCFQQHFITLLSQQPKTIPYEIKDFNNSHLKDLLYKIFASQKLSLCVKFLPKNIRPFLKLIYRKYIIK